MRELVRKRGRAALAPSGRRDKYGRVLAMLYIGEPDMAGIMVEEGLARLYDDGRRNGW